MRSLSALGHFNYTMGSLAEHDGDWEGFTIRLGPDLNEFIYGVTEAHGDMHKYTRSQMDFFEGSHPQIRLAYNSHGVYNGKGKNPNDWIVLNDQKVNQCIDIITRDGIQPHQCGHVIQKRPVQFRALLGSRRPL